MAKKALEWNVFRHDSNKNEIVAYNVFGKYIVDELKKRKNKCSSKEEFSEELKRLMMYYYWSKYEHEIVISSFPIYVDTDEINRVDFDRARFVKERGREPYRLSIHPEVGSKIDIYKQLEINWDKFLDYVWENI